MSEGREVMLGAERGCRRMEGNINWAVLRMGWIGCCSWDGERAVIELAGWSLGLSIRDGIKGRTKKFNSKE